MTTAKEASVKEQVRQFIMEELASAKGISQFTDDESLMANGVIDSLGVFRVVTFLEENFGLRVGDEEITAENLQSVDTIEQLVMRKAKK
jgi:acyl carrier protein